MRHLPLTERTPKPIYAQYSVTERYQTGVRLDMLNIYAEQHDVEKRVNKIYNVTHIIIHTYNNDESYR